MTKLELTLQLIKIAIMLWVGFVATIVLVFLLGS